MKALKDNYDELRMYTELIERGECHCDGTPWCVPGFMAAEGSHFGRLECVDNLAHASTTAQKVIEVAQSLGVLDHLDLYFQDAWNFISMPSGGIGSEGNTSDNRGDDCIVSAASSSGDEATADGQGEACHGGTGRPPLDLVWLDFGQGEKLGHFIELVWPRLAPGALVICHSTVTNSVTRAWLEQMRAR